MKKTLQIFSGKGKWRVSLTIIKTTPGKGIIAVLTGGEEPHVGAVAITIPCSVVHHPEKITSSTSVFAFPGHLDDKVAVPSAKKLSEKFKEPVILVCGLHIHNATIYDIKKLIRNSKGVVNKVTKF